MIGASSYQGAVGLLVLVISGLCALPIAAQSDAEMEACLTEGEIRAGWEELAGYTRSLKVTLDCDGREQVAAFKSLDVKKRGRYRLANGDWEFNFTDRFQYEVAAYRLDRALDLRMVPVAVLRRHRGKDGALVAWVPNAVHENQVSRRFSGPEFAALARQMSIVRMFDSLIYNVDRRPPNTLIHEATARVYMIDHGRSFREKKNLQALFERDRVWLSGETYSRLVSLDMQQLDEMLRGLTTRGQRKTLLERRDLIIEKIDRDRREFGDESVFIDSDR